MFFFHFQLHLAPCIPRLLLDLRVHIALARYSEHCDDAKILSDSPPNYNSFNAHVMMWVFF